MRALVRRDGIGRPMDSAYQPMPVLHILWVSARRRIRVCHDHRIGDFALLAPLVRGHHRRKGKLWLLQHLIAGRLDTGDELFRLVWVDDGEEDGRGEVFRLWNNIRDER